MSAVVEVATANVLSRTEEVVVLSYAMSRVHFPTFRAVATPLRTLSIGGTSLSAVAPDLNFKEGTAVLV